MEDEIVYPDWVQTKTDKIKFHRMRIEKSVDSDKLGEFFKGKR